jgi:RNA polymerase sigma-70 factor (family 1)
MRNYKDEQLFILLQDGDVDAFSEIFERYRTRLYVEAFRRLQDHDEANDIVQEAFCNVWEKRSSNAPGASLKAFLLTVVRNKCVDLIRKNISQRDKKRHYTLLADHVTTTTTIENAELGKQLNDAMSRVTPASRQAFEQLYINEKSLREIATEMEINVQSVKNHIHRALKVLRENLKHSIS